VAIRSGIPATPAGSCRTTSTTATFFQTNGPGWSRQGFTDLKTFDFSKANLSWDNDYYTRNFFNYSASLEQNFWDGKGGFEIAYDYQDFFSTNYPAFNSGINPIRIDINRECDGTVRDRGRYGVNI